MEETGLFSTEIWLNITSIFALLYALYIIAKKDASLLRGSPMTFFSLLIISATIIYIGTRPIYCYGDSWLYTLVFNLVQNGTWAKLPGDNTEPFFSFIEYTCIETTTASGWLFVVASFYIVGMSIAAYRWFPRHTFIAIVFLFTAFSFWGYATNGIRNGMATSIAMLGLSFFVCTRKELIIGYALLIIATLTHKSCMLTIAMATAALFFKNSKLNITFWLLCIIFGLLLPDQFKSLFSWLIDDNRMAAYLNAEVSQDVFSQIGFRWDFLLYSSLPIIIGWYTLVKRKIVDKTYSFLLHTYIFSNAFWVLINTAAFSNRFAYLSWFIYPIVLIYPFCKFKFIKYQSVTLGLLLIVMTAFTFVML